MLKKLKEFLRSLKLKYEECFFIGSTDILPPPLDKDKELECIIKAQKGDIEARNKLIEHNLRLVVFLAKKYENTGYDIEDLVSIGSIGLIKGIKTYKIDKNIKLATYASRCIANEILMFLRKNKKRRGEISLEDALNYDSEGNELHLEDILGTDNDIVIKAKNARKFLVDGDKVKITIRFKGREAALSHLGVKILDNFVSKLEDVCVVEKPAKQDGRNMTMVLAPKKA